MLYVQRDLFGCWEQLVPSMVAVGVAGLSDMDAP